MPRGKHGNHAKASRQYRWKPGGSVAPNGYVKLRVGKDHPLADPNGYAYEHLVVWCAAGRARPPKGFLLHHKNEDRTDNRLDNLELMRRGEHNSHHLKINPRARCPSSGRLLDGREYSEIPRASA